MPKSQIVAGLDAGTSQIKIAIASKIPGNPALEILGIGAFPSSGIGKGIIKDVDEASKCIRSAIDEIQKSSNQRIERVYVSFGSSRVFSVSSPGTVVVSRADQKISQEDIDRVIQSAQSFSLQRNKEILHTIPKSFTVDGEKGLKDVLGLSGVRLEVNALILGAFSPDIKNLTQSVLNSEIEIGDLVVNTLASSMAVLTPRQKELGVACLDIGAETSSLAVFEEGNLIHTAILPLGSASITNDIAIGLKCDINVAEKIKTEYGSAMVNGKTNKKKEIIDLSKTLDNISLAFYRKDMEEIIEARFSEIFELAQKELKKISRDFLLPAGIVLTGGGSKMSKIVELAKREMGLPCQIGLPQNVNQEISDPSFAVVCGLLLWGMDLEEEDGPGGGSIGGFFSKLKKIFRSFIP